MTKGKNSQKEIEFEEPETVEAEVVTTELAETEQPGKQLSTQITPMSLIEKAMEGDFDIDKMTKLYELQQKFEADQAEKAFNQAMSAFRAECPPIEKTRQGHNSKYAGLAEAIEQIKPVMAKHGLSHYWVPSQEGKDLTITCYISHKDGHKEEIAFTHQLEKSGNMNGLQSLGNTASYLERYSLFAGLGLASKEMDNDGAGTDEPEVDVISEEQWATLDTLISQSGKTQKGFCTYAQIKDLALLPVEKYDPAVKMLQKAIEKKESGS